MSPPGSSPHGSRLESFRRGVQPARDPELEEFARRHLRLKADTRRASTVSRDELSLRNFLEWAPDGIRLSQIDVRLLTDFQSWRLRQPGKRKGTTIAAQTVLHELHALSSLFKRAIAEDLVQVNPVARMPDKPEVERAEAVYLEPWEAARIIEAAGELDADPHPRAITFLRPLLAAFLLTGARKSGVFGIEVRDLEFADRPGPNGERGQVHLRPNAWRLLKRSKHTRWVPLWPQLEEILRGYVEAYGRREGLLFPAPSGGMLSDIRGSIAQAVELAGVEKHVTPHTFRHTYTAARLQTVDHGQPVSPYTVARELGTSVALIEKTYGHLLKAPRRGSVVEYRTADVLELPREA